MKGEIHMAFKTIHGDITKVHADALVNAANSRLLPGGGVCGAIFAKAGRLELQAACDRIETPLNDGDAVITSAFGIKNTKNIIHAVGPDFGSTPDAVDKLYDAYRNSLELLFENGLHSISFPLISAGIFGGQLENPAYVSACQCLKAYNEFLCDYPGYELDVRLCAFSDSDYRQAQAVFE